MPSGSGVSSIPARPGRWALYVGDVRAVLPILADSVHAAVTSAPYWTARDHGGTRGQLGHEDTVAAYVAALADLRGRALARVPRRDGTMWLILGDSRPVAPRSARG